MFSFKHGVFHPVIAALGILGGSVRWLVYPAWSPRISLMVSQSPSFMNNTSAEFRIASQVILYRDDRGLVDKGRTNNYSYILHLPNQIPQLEMSLLLKFTKIPYLHHRRNTDGTWLRRIGFDCCCTID